MQVFWSTAGLIVLLISSIVVIQLSETDAQRKARIQEEQAWLVRTACKLGERACAAAKEDVRKATCKLFPEDCY